MQPYYLEISSSMLFLAVRVSLWALSDGPYNVRPLAVKYVPEWFPGVGFKRFAKTAKMHIDNLANLPFQHVKESLEVREPDQPWG